MDITKHHPLQFTWVMYVDQYFENQLNLGTFNSIEMFWCYFNLLPPLQNLPHKVNIRFFQQGIQPSLEDEQNVAQWIISDKNFPKTALIILLEVIGYQIEGVTGVVFSKRNKQDRIGVWVNNKNLERQHLIGKYLKHILPSAHFQFKCHADAQNNSIAWAPSLLEF